MQYVSQWLSHQWLGLSIEEQGNLLIGETQILDERSTQVLVKLLAVRHISETRLDIDCTVIPDGSVSESQAVGVQISTTVN